MRRLIIGCGYVGRRAAERWRTDGDEVFAVTRSSERAAEFRERGWQPIVADVTDPGSLAALPQVDVVLHAVGYDRSAGPSQREVYVDGLRNVLEALLGSIRRFVHVSSTSVYGQSDGSIVDEESPCEPTRDSGRICLDAEELVRSHFSSANGAATIIRLAGIYGPDRLLRRIEALQSGEPIAGSPDAWLNLIHVDDAVAAITATADDEDAAGQTFLVCDDEPIPRRVYFEKLAASAGAAPPHFEPNERSRHGAGGLNKRCSNERIKAVLGSLSFPSIESGIPDAVGRSDLGDT